MEKLMQFDDHAIFSKYDELTSSTFYALKDIIMAQDPNLETAIKFGMPFFYYKGKMFAYLWYHKKFKQPYIGLAEGRFLDAPELLQEKRTRIKIFLIDQTADIPIKRLKEVLQDAIDLYKNGTITV